MRRAHCCKLSRAEQQNPEATLPTARSPPLLLRPVAASPDILASQSAPRRSFTRTPTICHPPIHKHHTHHTLCTGTRGLL